MLLSLSLSPSPPLSLSAAAAVRRLGGHSGGHAGGHGAAGGHASSHGPPVPQSMEAKLWGPGIDGLGGGRYQGWEPIVYSTYIISAFILIFGVGFAPETSIKSWANAEARTRYNMFLDMQEEGTIDKSVPMNGLNGFERNVHYNTEERKYKFLQDDVDKMPKSQYHERERMEN